MAVLAAAAASKQTVGFASAEEAQAVIGGALEAADRDPDAGPVLRALDLRQRIVLTDLGVEVRITSRGSAGEHLEWSFATEPGFEPRLTLRMGGATANRFLQGCESAALGIARGEIEVSGSSRAALDYLPAMRHLCRCYGSVVAAEHPHLVCRR